LAHAASSSRSTAGTGVPGGCGVVVPPALVGTVPTGTLVLAGPAVLGGAAGVLVGAAHATAVIATSAAVASARKVRGPDTC
jgi:hypothetical protein